MIRTNVRHERNKEAYRILKNFFKDKECHVGWLDNIKYPEKLGGISVVQAAIINEFGAKRNNTYTPARPFMRPTIANNLNKWRRIFSTNSVLKYDLNYLFTKLGNTAVKDIQKTIRSIYQPPLSPYTIRKRAAYYGFYINKDKQTVSSNGKKELKFTYKRWYQSSKPLIFTHLMINSISWKIVDQNSVRGTHLYASL